MYHAIPPAYAVLSVISHCYSPLIGRLLTCYSPVRHGVQQVDKSSCLLPFDLHVLCTPPAFILSQDQTLNFCLIFFLIQTFRLVFAFLFILDSSLSAWFFSKGYCLFFNVLYSLKYSRSRLYIYNILLSVICQHFYKNFLKFFNLFY